MGRFEELKAQHPGWSDEQIYSKMSLDLETDRIIEEKGEDIDVNDPDIMQEIIQGAMEWLDDVFPIIFEKVRDLFQNLLVNIGTWVQKGLKYLFDYINMYF